MDEETLEKLAVEEILKEAKRGAERAKEMGSLGWQKSPLPPTNKTFLRNMLVSTMRDAYNRDSKSYNSSERKRKHSGDLGYRSQKSFNHYKEGGHRNNHVNHDRDRKRRRVSDHSAKYENEDNIKESHSSEKSSKSKKNHKKHKSRHKSKHKHKKHKRNKGKE